MAVLTVRDYDNKVLGTVTATGEKLSRLDGYQNGYIWISSAGTAMVPGRTQVTRYHQHVLYALRSKEARERAGLAW